MPTSLFAVALGLIFAWIVCALLLRSGRRPTVLVALLVSIPAAVLPWLALLHLSDNGRAFPLEYWMPGGRFPSLRIIPALAGIDFVFTLIAASAVVSSFQKKGKGTRENGEGP